jgi:signal transduction histidine kinase
VKLLQRARSWILGALALGALLIGPEYLADHSTAARASLWIVSAVTAVPLLLLPGRPLAAWGLVVAIGVVQPWLIPLNESLPWPPLFSCIAAVVLFAVGLRHSRWTLIAIWAVTCLASVIAIVTHGAVDGDGHLNVVVVMAAALLAFGHLVGGRRRVERDLAQTEEQRAVLEERARIARELHDVVAHHMSVIAVQAETAAYRIPDLPDEGKACLADIASTARESLTEMRRLLGVLRSDSPEVQLAPQPGLGEVGELIAGARKAGLHTTAVTVGEPYEVPQAVGLSAYRIVQEALSNVVRHAPGARTEVTIAYEPSQLRVTVTNGPPATAAEARADGPGHGLIGMRERAGLLAGSLSAGPEDDGGYRVETVLPLAERVPG